MRFEIPSWLQYAPFGPLPASRRKKDRSLRDDSRWKQFLGELAQFKERPSPGVSKAAEKRRCQLWFVLNVDNCRESQELLVGMRYREAKKNGQLGQFKKVSARSAVGEILSDPRDAELYYLLRGCSSENTNSDYYSYSYHYRHISDVAVEGDLAHSLLERLCGTGRFVWVEDDSTPATQAEPLSWDAGSPWRLRLVAESDEAHKRWKLEGQLYRGDESRPITEMLLATEFGILVFPECVTRLDCGHSFRWLCQLKREPQLFVPFKARDAFLKTMYASGSLPELCFPPDLAVETSMGSPRGKLRFLQNKNVHYGLLAKGHFVYDDQEVAISEPVKDLYDAEKRHVVMRDRQRERELMGELSAAGLKPVRGWMYSNADFELSKGNLAEVAVRLAAQGWTVEADGVRIRHPRIAELNVSSGVDWFGLQGNFDFEGMTVSLPSLLEALRKNAKTITLSDGSQGVLPEKWLEQFGSLIELGEADGDVLKFRRSQALLLDALLAEHEQHAKVDAGFAEFRGRLASFSGVEPAEAPAAFQGALRDYQREGLGWLNFLREFRFGGCLADDMGLGKTIQVLALLEQRRCQRAQDNQSVLPSLIVVPKSLVFNWMDEASRFTPSMRVLNYTGIDRKQRLRSCDGFDVLLTTYGTLRNDILQLKDTCFDYAILDESQAIKNHASQAAKASRLLRADHRLALTGTPVENHLGELWSLFEFLNPGMLGRSGAFAEWSRTRRSQDDAGVGLLAKALRPFLLRRTKEQVLRELPEKTEQTIICEMSEEERAKYDELRDYYRANLAQRMEQVGLKKSKIHVLEALLRLRQAACHRGLLDKSLTGESSAKLDSLIEQVSEVIAEGHKALVFSQFTSLLAIVREQLEKRGVVYEYLDGRTRDRGSRVKRFQEDPSCPLFLISLKAGGHGLNLTAADYVFILDPWWNPAVEAQAVDRAHRIGQQRPVFAYRLICRDTVEDKIIELQKSKRQLADAIVSADNSLIQQLTTEDLQLLLS